MTITKNFPKIIYVISCPDGRQFRNAQFVTEENSINLEMKVTDQNVKTYTFSLSFSRRPRAPAPVSGTFPPARWSRARTSPRPPSARSSRKPASTWRSPPYSPSSPQVRFFSFYSAGIKCGKIPVTKVVRENRKRSVVPISKRRFRARALCFWCAGRTIGAD